MIDLSIPHIHLENPSMLYNTGPVPTHYPFPTDVQTNIQPLNYHSSHEVACGGGEMGFHHNVSAHDGNIEVSGGFGGKHISVDGTVEGGIGIHGGHFGPHVNTSANIHVCPTEDVDYHIGVTDQSGIGLSGGVTHHDSYVGAGVTIPLD